MSDHSNNSRQLERIQNLLVLMVKHQLKPILDEEFRDQKSKDIYGAADKATSRELAKKYKCSHTTIANLWKKWEAMGLLVKEGKSYRKVL